MPESLPQLIADINSRIPIHAMWDGFWIENFKRSNLQISRSQDRIYYRIFDLVFKKVIFFNLPPEWRDTNVQTEYLFRLSDREEFAAHHPDFDPQDRHVFAFDLFFGGINPTEKHTFFVLASRVFLFKPEPPDDKPGGYYRDPLGRVGFPCKENRVIGE